jgi:uncharacterized SAM-binding protein YcdF (DUF218 family)
MSIVLIFAFIIILLIFILFNRIKAALITVFITAFFFILIGNGLLPALLLKNLQQSYVHLPQPSWQKNNAIVLLGAGAINITNTSSIAPTVMAYSRIYMAANLYFNCKKSQSNCKIIVSGGDALKAGDSEASVYAKALYKLTIPKSAIILESQSLNTYKNAEYTSKILNAQHYDQIYLVTSGIHLTRSLLYFSHFGITAKPMMADYLKPQLSILPLSYNFAMADFAIHEYLGLARYYVYEFLGLNTEVKAAGIP